MAEQELDLSSKSEALQAQTGRQFVVATVKSLEGHPIEDYAYRLGRAWKIGDEKRDDGVILLVAPNERKVWIATGHGAGAFLTDAVSGLIVREAILPQFKKSLPDYGAGITAGADAIIKQMSLPPDQAKANAEKAQQQQAHRNSGGSALPAFFWIMIVIFVLLSMFRRAGGRRYRSRRGGISPWVVLWGLNELNRGSRGGLGRRKRRLRWIWRRRRRRLRRLFRRRWIVRRRRGRGRLVMLRLTQEDHDKVSAAIAAAEGNSSAEIVAVVSELSDSYHDVALHWAVLVLIAVLAWAAACPTCLTGGWTCFSAAGARSPAFVKR